MNNEHIRIPVSYDGGTATVMATVRRSKGDDWILLVHGWGCSRDSFAEAFGRKELIGRNLCAVDLLGFGEADRPRNFSYTLDAEAALLPQVADFLGAKRVTIVGHSMGGGVSLLAVPLFGKQLKQLISLEGSVGLPTGSLSSVFAQLRMVSGILLSMLRAGGLLAPSASMRRSARWLWHANARAMRRTAASLRYYSQRDDLLEWFATAPGAVYFCGEYGPRLQGVVPQLKQRDIRCMVIPSAGHVMMLDNPDAFYVALATEL